MKLQLRSTLIALATAAIITSTAGAQGYSTGFEDAEGFDAGFTLSGQVDTDPAPQQWNTTDTCRQ